MTSHARDTFDGVLRRVRTCSPDPGGMTRHESIRWGGGSAWLIQVVLALRKSSLICKDRKIFVVRDLLPHR